LRGRNEERGGRKFLCIQGQSKGLYRK